MNGYVKYVAQKLKFKTVRNYGINGCMCADNTGGTNPNSLCNRWTGIDPSADVMVILIGTNDFGGNIPIGTVESTDTRTFMGAYNVVLTGLLTAAPAVRIILMTPVIRQLSVNTGGKKVKDYADAVKEIAIKYNLPVVDLYSESGINSITYQSLLSDGLHPNDTGDQRIANMLIGKLLNI